MTRSSRNLSFPVVGVGASAGGLEAFTTLLKSLPLDTGMAFVLVQHLDPTHKSILTEILSRVTEMPVEQVRNGMPIKPNHVYVIPPNSNMRLFRNVLRLMPEGSPRLPIDYFFRSLAEDQKGRAIGVILSGAASDGARGLGAIKAEGGLTFAQDETAKYDGMPKSAMAAGCVDFVLPPEGIARELAKICKHSYVNHTAGGETGPDGLKDQLSKVLVVLRAATGVDFTHYKKTTLQRRLKRRMAIYNTEDLRQYLKVLHQRPEEAQALYNDILINVTSFFREPALFEVLKKHIFPELIKRHSGGAPLRIWVPGCSSGEEVYSIAICASELAPKTSRSLPIQIFGTDISDPILQKARTALYPESIAMDVSPERLRRFFVKRGGSYQILKSIRDLCIFAKQDITSDPPFSHLDLISCRNVLIYLEPVLQKRVLPIFHHALNPSGILLLGNSETTAGFSDLFAPVNSKLKIYSKRLMPLRFPHFSFPDYIPGKPPLRAEGNGSLQIPWVDSNESGLRQEADRTILSKYGLNGVIVNNKMEILQFRGHTGPYLESPSGVATANLLRMAREGLLGDMKRVLRKAIQRGMPVRQEGLRVKDSRGFKKVNITVLPIKLTSRKELYFLVLFEDAALQKSFPQKMKDRPVKRGDPKRLEITRLEKELSSTREYLQSIIEEQEATNEELKSANEEVQSSNEELQSTNEELETTREELQSTNEELTTINEELQNRNLELSRLNDDLTNLLHGVNVPIAMLSNDLRVRHLTPAAEKMLNLTPDDIGRPLHDLKLNFNVFHLEQLVREVIDNLSSKEEEILDTAGRRYSLSIRPYKTRDHKIDGVVMILFDKEGSS